MQVLKSVFMSLHSSVPDILGMTTSLTTMQGISLRTSSQPSSPLAAINI